jgi:hypothetical protein
MRSRHFGRSVRRAVVDDEDVRVRQAGAKLLEDGGEVLLLVPGRDEDEGLGSDSARVAAGA